MGNLQWALPRYLNCSSRSNHRDQVNVDAPCHALLQHDQLPEPSDLWLPHHPQHPSQVLVFHLSCIAPNWENRRGDYGLAPQSWIVSYVMSISVTINRILQHGLTLGRPSEVCSPSGQIEFTVADLPRYESEWVQFTEGNQPRGLGPFCKDMFVFFVFLLIKGKFWPQ